MRKSISEGETTSLSKLNVSFISRSEFNQSNYSACSVVGAVLIVLGLYSVLWGKYKENKEKREMEAMSLPLALQESKGCQLANRDIETSGVAKALPK